MNSDTKEQDVHATSHGLFSTEGSSLSDLLCKHDCAVFAYSESGYGENIEQLTHWDTLEGAIKSKESWFQKERNTFILARVNT